MEIADKCPVHRRLVGGSSARGVISKDLNMYSTSGPLRVMPYSAEATVVANCVAYGASETRLFGLDVCRPNHLGPLLGLVGD
jgi:hypothetical protein